MESKTFIEGALAGRGGATDSFLGDVASCGTANGGEGVVGLTDSFLGAVASCGGTDNKGAEGEEGFTVSLLAADS